MVTNNIRSEHVPNQLNGKQVHYIHILRTTQIVDEIRVVSEIYNIINVYFVLKIKIHSKTKFPQVLTLLKLLNNA